MRNFCFIMTCGVLAMLIVAGCAGKAELTQTKIENEKVKADLIQAKSELEKTRAELVQVKTEQEKGKTDLVQTKAELEKTKKELEQTREELAKMSPKQPSDEKVITTATGLQYVDQVVGAGIEAKPGMLVSVHYTGWLTNGTKFDSSRDRGQPFGFKLGAGQVIKGWDEGVAGMKIGGKRKLTIPSGLGYGAQDMGVIPPNSTLIFEVELLGIK